jgi:hypothetical protein
VHSISVALEQLREKLSGIDANSPGFYVFDVAFALNDAFDPLTFLASQPCFPNSTGSNVAVKMKPLRWGRCCVFLTGRSPAFPQR